MKEEAYLKDRLEDQLAWYSKKSNYNQKYFQRLRFGEIILATIIPFLSGMGDKIPYYHWIIGGIGVIISITAATITLFKYHENWIEYRTTEERLKHEKFMYLTNTKPYNIEGKFKLLVERVESIIAKENAAWAITEDQHNNDVKKES